MVKELETLYYMATMPFDLRICFITRRKRNYYNRSVLERIDNNITITERDNGYDAEIKDLDLNFLEEKPQCSLDNIEVTWTINIQKRRIFLFKQQ